jgi:hypothetical protein
MHENSQERFLVRSHDVMEFPWEREDEVKVGCREEFFTPGLQPSVRIRSMTLRATAIAAGGRRTDRTGRHVLRKTRCGSGRYPQGICGGKAACDHRSAADTTARTLERSLRVAAWPCVLELGHECVEGDAEGVHHLLGEMGIQSGGLRASVA